MRLAFESSGTNTPLSLAYDFLFVNVEVFIKKKDPEIIDIKHF